MMLNGSSSALHWVTLLLVVEPGELAGSIVLIGFVVAACSLVLASFAWVLSERERADERHRSADADRARVRSELQLLETLLGEADTAMVVWDGDSLERLSFSKGVELLDTCLAGLDAVTLIAALDGLRADGVAFELRIPHAQGSLNVQGRPIGRHAAVFLRPESASAVDHRAILEALPIPVWLRDKNLRLRWANDAFVEAVGGTSLEHAMTLSSQLDRSERDLALAAIDVAKPVAAKRYAVVQGVRRALSLCSYPLSKELVVGAAVDLSGATEVHSRLHPDAEGYVHALNQLSSAIAIFGPDRRLTFSNRAYVKLWGLEKDWLAAHPTEGEILDRLRELRLLPEQSDFAAWKRDRLKIFDAPRRVVEELWHLPTGIALRVTARPRPSGGLLYVFEDVSEQLRQEASRNALVKVQQATLDTLQEGVAVFGTDGRLRLHNSAFARLWQFADGELADAPHLNTIAERCSSRFGGVPAWKIISACVTSLTPDALPGPIDIERTDGKTLSLCLARLPDGSTLVTVGDLTDQIRLAAALRDGAKPPAPSASMQANTSVRPPKRHAS
jgi:PAS domain-containing protein